MITDAELLIINDLLHGLGVMYLLAVVAAVAVMLAILADLNSGLRKATERGERRTSYALSRTITKFVLYEGAVLVCVCMDTMIHFGVPSFFPERVYFAPVATFFVALLLCLVELFSIREKAEAKTRRRISEAVDVLLELSGKERLQKMKPQNSPDNESL